MFSMPDTRVGVHQTQRSGKVPIIPSVEKQIEKMSLTPAWQAYQKGMKEAAQAMNYATKPTWKTALETFKFWVIGLGVNLRSWIMGTLRGLQINFHYVLDKILPRYQKYLDKLKTVDMLEINLNGKRVKHPFVTYHIKPKSKDGSYNILILGDAGYPNATAQFNIDGAIQLAKTKNQPITCVVDLGDRLYPPNEANKDNSIFQSGDPRLLYTNIGHPMAYFFENEIPFVIATGNNCNATGHGVLMNQYLNLPPYYRVIVGEGEQATELYFLDESIMSSSEARRLDAEHHTTHFSEKYERDFQIQMALMKQALAQSTQEHPQHHRIIVKHFPLIPSNPVEANRDYLSARYDTFAELLEPQYGVSTFMNGHEHQSVVTEIPVNTIKPFQRKIKQSTTEIPVNNIVPFQRIVKQFTLGAGSHVELPNVQETHMTDTEQLAQQWHQSSRVHLDKVPLIIPRTSFGMLHGNAKGERQIAYITPPSGPQIHYKQGEVHPPPVGAKATPDRFKLLWLEHLS
jgi:hypothetical protein